MFNFIDMVHNIDVFCKVFNLDKNKLVDNFEKSHIKEMTEEYEVNQYEMLYLNE